MKPLREWSVGRLILAGVAWIATVELLVLWRPLMLTIAAARESGGDDVYIIVPHTPGGSLALLGPPLVVGALWLWIRDRDLPSNDR